ncbi:hypothetical protein FSP39_001369 [Pinctada imbricata]|uniref:Integrase catalytic domain-containing protein n=1 Tax=Pinctada imbricata TaxID=66713 RepID=A0AA88YLE6_PINIB|nr:hypothetical protein FSP39_001369 [Pinctada imbricata]
MDDDKIHRDIYFYLSNNSHPNHYTKDDKRELRSRASSYRVRDNKLLWKNRSGDLREVIFEDAQKQLLLKTFHDEMGHMGRERTYQKISNIYYWKRQFHDVEDFIKTCAICQTTSTFQKSPEVLHPIKVVSPWYHIGMDLITMPKSKLGNNYILTVVDYFSKWPEAVAIQDKRAETVAASLYNIIMRLGFPAVYSSDQGREFVNSTLQSLLAKTKSAQRIFSSYHPQTNGLTERFNRTLQDLLVKVCSEEQDDWDEFIEEALFSYRSGKQKSTKFTPFEIMFGRPPIQTKDSDICMSLHDDDLALSVTDLRNIRNDINQKVKENVEKSQEDQIKRSKSKIPINRIKVLRFNSRKASRKGSKMERKWLGPYVVLNVTEKGVATLRAEDGSVLSVHYNIKHLKKVQ